MPDIVINIHLHAQTGYSDVAQASFLAGAREEPYLCVGAAFKSHAGLASFLRALNCAVMSGGARLHGACWEA